MIWLHIQKGGMFTTVQDLGRVGYRSKGIPLSGALDRSSAILANWLVGNEQNSPVLEMTADGISADVKMSCCMAVTGGTAEVLKNGELVEMHTTLFFEPGDILQIGRISVGYRAYLAVGGLIRADTVLNSYSTYVPGKFGGIHGSAVKKNHQLFLSQMHMLKYELKANDSYQHTFTQEVIRLVTGPEWARLSDPEIEFLLSTKFTVRSESDRMGIRLVCKKPIENDHQMISAPVLPGTIQLLPNGNPVILMADGQTTGGYPRIGQVIRIDLDVLAQKQPGEQIRFKLISMEEAIYVYRYRAEKLNALFRK
jgi:antagonist of KipI